MPGTHNRAAHRETLQYNVENRRWKLARRKSNEADSALSPHHLQRLRERGGGDGRHQDAMRASSRRVQDLLDRILSKRIDGEISACRLRESMAPAIASSWASS